MLAQRVITAVLLLALLIGALAWSVLAFEALATIVIAAALGEWLELVGWPRLGALLVAAAFGLALLAAALLQQDLIERMLLPLSVLAIILWLALALLLLRADAIAIRLPRLVGTVLALLMTSAAWAALVHFLMEGVVVLLSILAIVWLADTAAYFCGRAFGRTKLAPHISPGKTWAGVVGAVVAVALAALVARQLFPDAPLFSNDLLQALGAAGALLLALLVLLSVAGDLYESLLKRQAGVKDSGRLLPGHGGAFDRIDALLPVLPFAVLLQWMAR